MKTKWMCVAFWAGTMLLTGCHTAVDQSGQEKTEPIAPTFTITTKPQIYVLVKKSKRKRFTRNRRRL